MLENERFVRFERFVFKINIQPASELLIGFTEHELNELNESVLLENERFGRFERFVFNT